MAASVIRPMAGLLNHPASARLNSSRRSKQAIGMAKARNRSDREARGSLVLYPNRPREPEHQRDVHAELGRRLAALPGLAFAGQYQESHAYAGRLYWVPSDSVIGLDAAALDCFPGFFASRRNYHIGQGRDAKGRFKSGVLEQSWRIGGALRVPALYRNPGWLLPKRDLDRRTSPFTGKRRSSPGRAGHWRPAPRSRGMCRSSSPRTTNWCRMPPT